MSPSRTRRRSDRAWQDVRRPTPAEPTESTETSIMKRTALISIALAGLALVGCGSDSDSNSVQDQAADAAIEAASDSGMELDEDCVRDVTSNLSDADAEAIADGNDSDVSPEGDVLKFDLISCADQGAVIDLFIEGMNESGQNFDEDCVREQMQGVDIAELVQASQNGGQPPADIVAAMTECIAG